MRQAKLVMFAVFVAMLAQPASGAPLYFNGFETDTAGWSAGGGYGTITRVSTGQNGITSSAGANHAEVTATGSGPYTNFGAYSSVWPGGYSASVDVYLDTGWTAGMGFDYSVASSNSANGHLRDFIFHVGVQQDGKLRVGGSNNSNFNTRMDLANLNNYHVTTSGWYTFLHNFRDDGGVLAVDLQLYQGNSLLFTETRSNAADLIGTVVGGNRYGWFTHADGLNYLAIDNASLDTASNVPEPTSMVMLGLGLLGAGVARRRRSAS